MLVLTGADLVLPDRVVPSGTIVVDDGRIARIADAVDEQPSAISLPGHTIVPGFVDVHVHGVDGTDTLDAGEAVARIAARMPRYGVTAFCPTTVACTPDDLRRMLMQVARCRANLHGSFARVLPAHLESNFINPELAGAQPLQCLRTFAAVNPDSGNGEPALTGESGQRFTATEVLAVIDEHRQEIGIVTLAPEMPGGLDLIAWLRARGLRVALGHSSASYDEAMTAFDAGARHATHLFNRMPRLHHRHPGLAGAVLERTDVDAEIICDGAHVHPAFVRMAIALKGTARVLAITDATAAAGCGVGTSATLGGRAIVVGSTTALLADGTVAGGVVTMDGVFRWLTRELSLSPVDAATMCSTAPARAVGLENVGALTEGSVADIVVLGPDGRVARTFVAGQLIYDRDRHPSNSLPAASV